MKRTSLFLVIVITVAMLVQTFSFAWMSDNGLSSIINVSGAVHKNYFAYGDGSKETPYGIANPVQLYYFAWLQYLGYFNNTDNNNDKVRDPFYFELDPKLKEDPILKGVLDMKGYKLPPIGTIDNPFIGSFNGNGITIANLTVKNYYNELSAPPSGTDQFGGADIIGFFGVIGSISGDDYKYETLENEVKNLILKDITIETQTEKTLIGLVAGYVNGVVDCVGVMGSTINIKDTVKGGTTYTANLSDYSLIGYCTDEYKDSVYLMDVTLSTPGVSDIYNLVPDMTSDGEGHGWGGSVKMDDMFTMLKTIRDSNNYSTNYSTFIYERTDAIINGKRVTLNMEDANKRVYYDPNFGAIVYSPRSGTTYASGDNNQDYNYLSGGTRVTLVECETSGTVDGYYITDGTNYLTISGVAPNAFIINTTSKSDAAIWRFSNGANGGTAYTVVGGYMYYLCLANNELTIYSVENSTAKTSWSVSNTGISSGNAYIDYRGNEWTIIRSGKKISNGNGVYLTVDDNGTLTYTRDESAAVTWTFSNINGSGTVYTQVNNTTYYLRCNNQGALSASPNSTNWTYNSSNRRLSCSVWSGRNYYTYYLSCSGTTWSAATSTTNATVVVADFVARSDANLVKSEEQVDSYKYTSTFKLDNNESNRYFDEDGEPVITNNLQNKGITCYPLTFEYNSNNRPEVSSGNTGYVISSSYDTTVGSGATFPNRSGDIRVSKYPSSNLGNSRTNPYCMNYTTSSFKQVNSLNGKGLNKYSDCYDDYNSSTQSSCYGIHFMNSKISIDSLVSVDNVTIFGKTYDNYEMPTACIDFNLKESGFINFFAGTYFTNNNTFFSLHKIERGRDENDPETYNKILSIKEIQHIYGVVRDGAIDFTVPYYYTYKDGTSDSIDSKYASEPYQIIFDTDWITNPRNYGTWNSSATYYFEVPVYAGEYALGSVEGGTGAYLVYLDLAANAQILEREKTYEEITENSATSTIPNGVDFIAPGEAVESDKDKDYSDSAFVQINNGTSGSIEYDKEGNVISHSATSGTTAEYVGVNGTLVDGNGNVMTVPWDSETLIKRTTYRDYNVNTSVSTVTVIDEIHITEGGKTTIKYTKDVTITDAQGNVTVKPQEKSDGDPLKPDTQDDDSSPKLSAGEKLIDIAFAYGTELEDLTVSYLYTPGVKDENGNLTTPTYVITIINPGTGPITVKAILTELGAESGITFVISDGTTENILTNSTDPQLITINSSGAGGESGESGDVVEGG